MSMTTPIQLEFAFIERRVMLARIRERAETAIDFEEYEWHRRRYDRLTT